MTASPCSRAIAVLSIVVVTWHASLVHAQISAPPVKKTIVGGTMPKYPPFEFKDPETDKLMGFDIDFAEALAAKMGAKIEWQETNFDQMISSITTKRTDVVLSGIADTEEREKSINFLDYLTTGPQFYTLKARAGEFPDPEALCGKRVATARRTSWPDAIATWSAEHCVKAGKPAVIVVGTDGSPDTRLQLNQNRVDAAVQGGETLPYQNTLENGVYAPIGKPFVDQLMGMGISKSNPELTAALLDAFKQILADGTYQKLLVKWGLQEHAVKKGSVNGKG